jgi:curli biogenesis system outer membrane secretion channel CsgG
MLLLPGFLLLSCAATRPVAFLHPEFDFSAIERVAVVPFENLSTDQGIGEYMSRIFVTELLATETFDIVEPGEISKFLSSLGQVRVAELSLEQIQELGKLLNVQAVIFGTVGESTQFRSGSMTSHVVSLDVRMVSVEMGVTVWSATVSTAGPGFFPRLFGFGEQTRGTAARKAARKVIKTLIR